MPHKIDRLCQLLEFAGDPVAISVNGTVKAGRDCGAKSRWRQTDNVIAAQMGNEIVPDRFRFRISVNKNNGHPCFSPKGSLPRARSAGFNVSLRHEREKPLQGGFSFITTLDGRICCWASAGS